MKEVSNNKTDEFLYSPRLSSPSSLSPWWLSIISSPPSGVSRSVGPRAITTRPSFWTSFASVADFRLSCPRHWKIGFIYFIPFLLRLYGMSVYPSTKLIRAFFCRNFFIILLNYLSRSDLLPQIMDMALSPLLVLKRLIHSGIFVRDSGSELAYNYWKHQIQK